VPAVRVGVHERALEVGLVVELPAWRHGRLAQWFGRLASSACHFCIIGSRIAVPAGRTWFGNTIA
jgi:hypothetical protein